MKTTFRRVGSYLFSLILLAVVAIAWFERQALYDWWRLRNYTPPARIVQLATNANLTPAARHIFYVYHPELDDRSKFNAHCSAKGEQTIVLGCYVSPTGIYIYDIKDSRLSGITEVTAAHEMLHAAYDRLGTTDKKHVNELIADAYTKVTDERIRSNIENYRKQGADVGNELHSILGTEVRTLPTELEQYYQRYFTNRGRVVSDSERYESTFTSLKNQAQQISDQLQNLKKAIEALEQQLSQQQVGLETDRSDVKTQAQADRFNARVRTYNNQINYLNQLVAQYNTLRDEYNQLAVQQQQLFKAIDSRPTVTTQ